MNCVSAALFTRMFKPPPPSALLLCLVLAASGAALAGGGERFELDLASAPEGPLPRESLFVVDGVFEVVGKTLLVQPEPLADANAQLGPSAKGAATIEARVFGSRQARSFPRFGLSIHGMSGHRLLVNAAQKRLELVRNDEVLASAPFTWETDTWSVMRLEAARKDGPDSPWVILGWIWSADGPEPTEPLIEFEDSATLKGNGRCGLWAIPYSGKPILFDKIRGTVETGE
jgi:hypothetical protein